MGTFLITGAGGMLGRKLSRRLAEAGHALILHDIVTPDAPPGARAACLDGDIAAPGVAESLVAHRPDGIVHLAAVVSGEAEADFDKGYRVNLDGTRALLEAVRLAGSGWQPRFVFASSLAVFGAPFPDVIPDDWPLTPLTSYGAQKAMGEALVSDYSRRGFVDGIGIRLPTVCVRPGKPNRAASGFYSGIIREPLNGQEAVLPVSTEISHWFASPRAATGFLLHAATMDTADMGTRRMLTMPGIHASVAEEIAALRRVGGEDAVARIKHVPDPVVDAIVRTWPRAFVAGRARALGFVADRDFDEIVRIYLEDDFKRPA